MKLMVLFLSLMLFSGALVFCSQRKHLLSIMLSLEFMVLSIFMMFFVVMSKFDFFFSLFYLTFSACEGAMGLSILVVMSRTHGGDYFKTFNFLI